MHNMHVHIVVQCAYIHKSLHVFKKYIVQWLKKVTIRVTASVLRKVTNKTGVHKSSLLRECTFLMRL